MKSWLALFQVILKVVLVLEQVLAPQVSGLEETEVRSPKAGIAIAVKYWSIVTAGRVGTIIEFAVRQSTVNVNVNV